MFFRFVLLILIRKDSSSILNYYCLSSFISFLFKFANMLGNFLLDLIYILEEIEERCILATTNSLKTNKHFFLSPVEKKVLHVCVLNEKVYKPLIGRSGLYCEN